jgi:hypothetical protein
MSELTELLAERLETEPRRPSARDLARSVGQRCEVDIPLGMRFRPARPPVSLPSRRRPRFESRRSRSKPGRLRMVVRRQDCVPRWPEDGHGGTRLESRPPIVAHVGVS